MIKYNSITKQIQITRGDTTTLNITAKDSSGNDYIFPSNSVVRFMVAEKNNESNVVISKTIEVQEDTKTIVIKLSSEDTKIGEIINKPVVYWYEVSVEDENNEVQTIIGYDSTGAKEFVLYPEALEED